MKLNSSLIPCLTLPRNLYVYYNDFYQLQQHRKQARKIVK